jgi:hypothetical protein
VFASTQAVAPLASGLALVAVLGSVLVLRLGAGLPVEVLHAPTTTSIPATMARRAQIRGLAAAS